MNSWNLALSNTSASPTAVKKWRLIGSDDNSRARKSPSRFCGTSDENILVELAMLVDKGRIITQQRLEIIVQILQRDSPSPARPPWRARLTKERPPFDRLRTNAKGKMGPRSGR